MLQLHDQYQAKKKQLTDRAFVDGDAKTDFQTKMEQKYTEVDVKVRKTYNLSLYTILDWEGVLYNIICTTMVHLCKCHSLYNRQRNDSFTRELKKW